MLAQTVSLFVCLIEVVEFFAVKGVFFVKIVVFFGAGFLVFGIHVENVVAFDREACRVFSAEL